ncbi:MAG TPA: hypothetical protein VNR42_05620, partial [Solirubrobacteraceae bacterium]|nr:hypothetical protein [Solirubrobacteraceae bacterium]
MNNGGATGLQIDSCHRTLGLSTWEVVVSAAVPNPELKARHRAMWASGDYPSMVETFLLPLGPRLVEAC